MKGNLEKFQLKYVANIDQAPLPFVLDANSTSDTVSAEESWVPDTYTNGNVLSTYYF